MTEEQLRIIKKFAATKANEFHESRLNAMKKIKLKDMLKRCNPYLLRVKNLVCAKDLVRELFDVRLSRSEQTIFGDSLEKIAICVRNEIYAAVKSGVVGMDMEFIRDNDRYIVSIKSGPNWGNSSATQKQKELFTKTEKTIRQKNPDLKVRSILGCCYGKRKSVVRDGYDHYCGQKFWSLLSGSDNLYIDIMEALDDQSRNYDQEFKEEYDKCLDSMIEEFIKNYCYKDRSINWEALIKFNSKHEEKPPPKKQVHKKCIV